MSKAAGARYQNSHPAAGMQAGQRFPWEIAFHGQAAHQAVLSGQRLRLSISVVQSPAFPVRLSILACEKSLDRFADRRPVMYGQVSEP